MKKTVLAVAIAAVVTPLHANEQSKKQPTNLEHIQIISHHDRLRTESGSATLLTEVELEKFEYDDIHRILSSVPGVNIREEDGYGLRPNIGFRGVTPERSKKNHYFRRWRIDWPCAVFCSCSLLFSGHNPHDCG